MSKGLLKTTLILTVAALSPAAIAWGQCPAGDVTLDTQAAVAAFPSDCINLAGNLFIADADPPIDPVVDLGPLANLETIGGVLRLERLTMLQTASFPALTNVMGVRLLGSSVQTLGLPELQSALGILIDQNQDVAPIDQLQLATLDLSSLTTVGELQIKFSQLTSLSLPSLTTVEGFVELWGHGLLTNLSLPSLSTVGGYFYLSVNSALTRLELPALTSLGQLLVQGNSALTSIELPALVSPLEFVRIAGNSSLSDCCSLTDVLALVEPESIVIRDNAPGCRTVEEIERACNALGIPTLGASALLLLAAAVAAAGLVVLRA